MNAREFMARFYIISLLCLISAFAAYGRTQLNADGSLALPSVPAELRQPVDRADYIALHFWDAMDWTDTLRGHDQAWMEQQLANYLSVLPHAHADSVSTAIDRFMTAAQIDKETYELLSELAAGYLFNSDSPVRNDGFYIMFLENNSKASVLSDSSRERAAWMLDELNKNRVGCVAHDFSFDTRTGASMKLSDINSGRDILLLFYDPDCSTCHEVISELTANPLNVTVVAICVEGERDAWLDDARRMPADWIVGYPSEAMDEIYALFEMPTMLLLTPEHKVKMTNVRISDL